MICPGLVAAIPVLCTASFVWGAYVQYGSMCCFPRSSPDPSLFNIKGSHRNDNCGCQLPPALTQETQKSSDKN